MNASVSHLEGPVGGIAPQSTRVSNLAHFLHRAARRDPEGVALVWGDRVWTWSALNSRVDAMAAALVSRFGCAKGDRILVQSQNCNQMLESMVACFRAGLVWVPTNFRQTPKDVADLAVASGAVGMICNASFPDHAEAVGRAQATLRFSISIGQSAFGLSYDDIVDENLGASPGEAAVDRDDPCWFFFTSGTTGRPKAAVLTHGQMTFVVNNHLCDLMPGLEPGAASLVLAPLSHGAGVHQLTQIAKGVKTILLPSERFDIETAWALIERWRVSTLFTVPTILKMLVEHESARRFDRSSLRYVIYAGAPMYREDQKRAIDLLGPVLVQYYGLGEVTGAITGLPPALHDADDGSHRLGTCGLERTGMEISIRDEDGRTLETGEIGEICCIGPAVFAGYFENPDANAKAFRDGWFRTGDLGFLDAERFLTITGRASDMYISGGSNIHPREIEEKILTLPGISEVAVLGMPDPLWGEIGVAVCVLEKDAHLGEGDIKTFLEERIAKYKVPRRILIWDALPKSAYGKTPKNLVREEINRRAQFDTED